MNENPKNPGRNSRPQVGSDSLFRMLDMLFGPGGATGTQVYLVKDPNSGMSLALSRDEYAKFCKTGVLPGRDKSEEFGNKSTFPEANDVLSKFRITGATTPNESKKDAPDAPKSKPIAWDEPDFPFQHLVGSEDESEDDDPGRKDYEEIENKLRRDSFMMGMFDDQDLFDKDVPFMAPDSDLMATEGKDSTYDITLSIDYPIPDKYRERINELLSSMISGICTAIAAVAIPPDKRDESIRFSVSRFINRDLDQ